MTRRFCSWCGSRGWVRGRKPQRASGDRSAIKFTPLTSRVSGSSWWLSQRCTSPRGNFLTTWSTWLLVTCHGEFRSFPFFFCLRFRYLNPRNPCSATVGWQTFACCVVGLGFWCVICLSMRYTLKLLLMYKGFMFEARGRKTSLTTIVWGLLVKCEKVFDSRSCEIMKNRFSFR